MVGPKGSEPFSSSALIAQLDIKRYCRPLRRPASPIATVTVLYSSTAAAAAAVEAATCKQLPMHLVPVASRIDYNGRRTEQERGG